MNGFSKTRGWLRSAALGAAMLATAGLALPATALADGEVNVYSYRQPYLVNPLFDAFTKETGIKVNVIFAKKGLIERMAAEGRNSPADVLLTVDIGRLTSAVKNGVSQTVSSPVLDKNVPATYRDPPATGSGLRAAPVSYTPPRNGSPNRRSPMKNLPTRNGRARSASGRDSTYITSP